MSGQDLYRKFHGASVETDWFRVVKLYELCQSVPGLHAPRPVKIDLEWKGIEYERVDCTNPLMHSAGDLIEVFHYFGQRLAQFHLHAANHGGSFAHGEETVSLLTKIGLDRDDASELNRQLPRSFLHGDCWHGNVFVTKPRSFLILDPLPAAWFRPILPALGNSSLDVAYFIFSTKLRLPLFNLAMRRAHYSNQLAHSALDGYLSKMRAQACKSLILKLSHILATIWLDEYPRRLIFPIGQVKRFIGYKKLDTKT